jgi:hypothetical protein
MCCAGGCGRRCAAAAAAVGPGASLAGWAGSCAALCCWQRVQASLAWCAVSSGREDPTHARWHLPCSIHLPAQRMLVLQQLRSLLGEHLKTRPLLHLPANPCGSKLPPPKNKNAPLLLFLPATCLLLSYRCGPRLLGPARGVQGSQEGVCMEPHLRRLRLARHGEHSFFLFTFSSYSPLPFLLAVCCALHLGLHLSAYPGLLCPGSRGRLCQQAFPIATHLCASLSSQLTLHAPSTCPAFPFCADQRCPGLC